LPHKSSVFLLPSGGPQMAPNAFARCVSFLLLLAAFPALAQKDDIPKNIADSVGGILHFEEDSFYSVAEAMPEDKYGFVPSAGNYKDVRSFAEQVKHVACGQFAFFNEIEGKTPPEGCEKGGADKARSKAELLKYLRDSFDYGNRVLGTITTQNAMDRVEGPYAGPNTRLG